jgi:hypothetical protein
MRKFCLVLLGITCNLYLIHSNTITDTLPPLFSLKIDSNHMGLTYESDGDWLIKTSQEGLWKIGTGWENGWVKDWKYGQPDSIYYSNGWTILEGTIPLKNGVWNIKDAWQQKGELVIGKRRFEWMGTEAIDSFTLSINFTTNGIIKDILMPGILYNGNPAGHSNTPDCVPHFNAATEDFAIFEEHRFPMPFTWITTSKDTSASLALITQPSQIPNSRNPDHWWSMGAFSNGKTSELALLSGPIGYNGQKSVAKALQCEQLAYDNTYFKAYPGMVIEKTFYLKSYPTTPKEETTLERVIDEVLEIFQPYSTLGLPSFEEIIQSKIQFALNRWISDSIYAGFNMYPHDLRKEIVMGWAGQAEAPGYGLQFFAKNDPSIVEKVQKAMDFLSSSKVEEDGFGVRYSSVTGTWTNKDPVSMGQAMNSFAMAIEKALDNPTFQTEKWAIFLNNAAVWCASEILKEDWEPRSTAEAFFIAPLIKSSALFDENKFFKAAIKVADYYYNEYYLKQIPYWGGTLDASGEDKEGAWAAFQGFLAAYEATKDKKYLLAATHAGYTCLSYAVVWDIPMPPGRLEANNFKARGWTVVSPQNQHLDVYGVLIAPSIYKLGVLLDKPKLKEFSKVMYLSCGQMISPEGIHGEQIQHTNFAQRGNMSDVYRLRGGYAEDWTVFWITAHFITAAAEFASMDVNLSSFN